MTKDQLKKFIVELEEKNKKLKEEKEIRALNDRDNLIQIEKLGKENKKLKSDLEWYKKHYWPKPLTTIEEVQNCEWNTIWM